MRPLTPKKLGLGFDSLTVLANGRMPIVGKAKGVSVCRGVENLPHFRLCSGLSPETRRSSAGVRGVQEPGSLLAVAVLTASSLLCALLPREIAGVMK